MITSVLQLIVTVGCLLGIVGLLVAYVLSRVVTELRRLHIATMELARVLRIDKEDPHG